MEWQPIETAPKDGEKVLIYYPAFNEIFAAKFEHGTWQTGVWSAHPSPQPSVWMPLPEPPA